MPPTAGPNDSCTYCLKPPKPDRSTLHTPWVAPCEPVEKSLLRTLRDNFGLSVHEYRFSAVIENIDETETETSHEIRFVFEVDLTQLANEGFRNSHELKWCWWGSIDSLDIRPQPVAEHLRAPEQQQQVWAPWAGNADTGAP